MPHHTVSGLRMHYRLRGSGPTVVLLHGLGSCADDWWLQSPALAEAGYAVLAPDLRGHGHTDKPPGPYTIAQMADDVAGLMEGLGVRAAHVVGLSLGGAVAQDLTVRHPERVRSLVLVNTFARFRPQGIHGWRRFLRRGIALLTGGLEKQAEVIAWGMFPHRGQEALRRGAVERIRANDPVAYQAAIQAVLRFDGRRGLTRIRVPTLVVAGAEDTTVDMAAKEELAAGIPGARLVVVPRSGHATPLDRPVAFNRLLLEFLQSLVSPQRIPAVPSSAPAGFAWRPDTSPGVDGGSSPPGPGSPTGSARSAPPPG